VAVAAVAVAVVEEGEVEAVVVVRVVVVVVAIIIKIKIKLLLEIIIERIELLKKCREACREQIYYFLVVFLFLVSSKVSLFVSPIVFCLYLNCSYIVMKLKISFHSVK
jgi:hypothetical protein